MLVRVSTPLPCSLEAAVTQVCKPQLLLYVAEPLVRFSPMDPPAFPARWAEGTYWVTLQVLGFIPFGRQAIRISFPPIPGGFAIRDNGYSAVIPVWDHTITLTPTQTGCHYEDRIEVAAGWLTPFVWLFAQVFYRHRQNRWRRLVRRGFHYDET